jgi:hypothetical protein
MSKTLLPATFHRPGGDHVHTNQGQKNIVGAMRSHVRWFTPTYYTDGSQRAQLYGDLRFHRTSNNVLLGGGRGRFGIRRRRRSRTLVIAFFVRARDYGTCF